MTPLHTVYISLGSNEGNRVYYLQKALFLVGEKIGSVQKISPVYESPAWGFESDPFLNTCAEIETALTPEQALDHILEIEKSLGRIRSEEEGYRSRTIDIDILYFDKIAIESERLKIPHPGIPFRRFVLKPLADIAPQFYHPVLNKDTRNLLQECRDESTLTKTDIKLHTDWEEKFADLHFVTIEGNIGAGKTSLAQRISEDYKAKLVLERFADNPFLPKFYEDQARYAFPLEMSFMADRYQQFTEDTTQFDLFKKFMVSDYDVYKSLIFAKITLQPDEYLLYRKVFDLMYREVRKPNLYLYLYQTTDRLLENIRKRGRSYEQRIEPDYLERINKGYFDFIKSYPEQKTLILDVSELDFVQNPADYEYVLDRILHFTAASQTRSKK
ncbi:2-amino-4-hydroxy-6-hydroxymethyldihydropteridinediphosphokinase [Muriicola jejuensis]|uniref:2-amino-4-hydroxy-6-hydroxymethyldihydropteridine pyrophosphokinase n=1 Tax=Muriicola jejuensis TaxID=504488 RepID=A0A6P0U8F2_9FLAO|nr:2-amino-4-hydroxy-6-hydroxymethyldihydropteridine diphosphokinase [Muriicola jejuensis]NER09435.1 2-amino-4-hydroxy-6-hydroxymethyldihydropteridine diphosphokinase [Muriicola jejuensis]SMP08687.1 2-amino-4-hydroxy-6-hydroxymethyldihydropteridinediphosphokinase [Muriicola jejuensis]